MNIGLTGWGGFLAHKLRESTELNWQESVTNCDALLLMGSPTFTHHELDVHDAQVIHQYVRQTIKEIDRCDKYIIFASSTGVDDIKMDHTGSTAYNLAKLYLENYIVNHCDKYLILRIGTVISSSHFDVNQMRDDRIQPRILRGDYTNIPLTDEYLDVDTFKKHTIDAIKNQTTGILEYPLVTLKLSELIRMTKND
jgi:hypothetical protein